MSIRPIVGLLLCAAHVSAQVGFQSTTYGNSSLGGNATAHAQASTHVSGRIYYATTQAGLGSNVTLLNRSSNVGDVLANAWRSKEYPGTFGGMAAGLRVLAAGNVVYLRSLGASGSLGSFARSYNVFPSDVVVALSLGGIPLTLRGNVSAYVSANGNATMSPTLPEALLTSNAYLWQSARCAATSGFAGFTVTTECTGQLPQQILSTNLQARSFGTTTGTANYTREAIRLRLAIVINYLWQRITTTLVDVSVPRLARDLMRP